MFSVDKKQTFCTFLNVDDSDKVCAPPIHCLPVEFFESFGLDLKRLNSIL